MKTSKPISPYWHVLIIFKVTFFLFLFTPVYLGTDLKAHPIVLLPVLLLCLGALSFVASGLAWQQPLVSGRLRRTAVVFLALSLLATGAVIVVI